MLPLSWLRIGFIFFTAGCLAGQSVISPGHGEIAEPTSASLALEIDRAVLVLRRGMQERWDTRDQYLTAFEKTPNTDSTAHSVATTKRYVGCVMNGQLRVHQVWDEGSPLAVEARRTISQLIGWRKEAAAHLPLPPCPKTPEGRVTLASGVAMRLLKTKVDPTYPGDVRASGTVVLHALISSKGRVESLDVLSGPVMLQQSALVAVRQWTFRPYLLNDKPAEVETTLDVVFASSKGMRIARSCCDGF
jgi:TonB family protein